MHTKQFMVPYEISSTLHVAINFKVFQGIQCSLSEFPTAAILQGHMSTTDHNSVKCQYSLDIFLTKTPAEREKK
jgi:hypothetical protein